MEKQQKYKFEFLTVTNDMELTDQNVHSYKFINKGASKVTINEQLILNGVQPAVLNLFDSFSEDIICPNCKTSQGYSIVFSSQIPKERQLQVIMKIPVQDK